MPLTGEKFSVALYALCSPNSHRDQSGSQATNDEEIVAIFFLIPRVHAGLATLAEPGGEGPVVDFWFIQLP